MKTTTQTNYILKEGNIRMNITDKDKQGLEVVIEVVENGFTMSYASFIIKTPTQLSHVSKFFEQVAGALS